MQAAGFVLTGQRKIRSRAHPPLILFHSLTTDFFGIEERQAEYPDFESFNVWPATARLLYKLRRCDHLAGQTCVDQCGTWFNQATRRFVLCTREEAKREAVLIKHLHICVKPENIKCGFPQIN